MARTSFSSYLEKPSQDSPLWLGYVWHVVKRYPIPVSTALLLLLSLIFWTIKLADLSNWTLLAVVILGGIPLLWESLQQFLHKEFSVDVIAILAIIGSVLLKQYLAGALIVLMMSGGEALEAYALRKARLSLTALAERIPRIAHIWQGNELINIAAEMIQVGMEIVIKPGEQVPVDGVVTSGSVSLSEADLTGEALPVRKSAGMLVLSGSVNLDGVLGVRATKKSIESKYAQIVHLVEEAQTQKAPIHRLADRYSIGFSIAAISLATLAWIISGDSVYALAVLVVATPCPLILATPIAIMSGIDRAASNGIIVKSGTALEQLSTHILAHAVVEASHEPSLSLSPASDFEEIYGKGVHGRVPVAKENQQRKWHTIDDSVKVAIGNRTFMRRLGVEIPNALLLERERRTESGQICSFIVVEQHIEGLLVLEDVPRAGISQLSTTLRSAGIKEIILLTGDSEVVAQQIGKLALVDRIVSRCLPEDKGTVKELLEQGHRVLMVGDGINDAPVLATATVGMALGAQGLTAADAVLLSTDIMRVGHAVYLGRRVMHIALQGIWFGMALSSLAMLFAAFGFIPPATGALLQEGIDVLVILNALRVGRITF